MASKNITTSLAGALLLTLSWYYNLTPLIFAAFVPLLQLEKYFHDNRETPKRKLKFYGYTYLTFFLWNLGVTWWVYFASAGGAALAILANAALMTMVFVTFSNIKSKINSAWSVWLLIPVWLAWEHLHSLWDLTWTWLNLGNVLSYRPNWVQWFEFTGTSGGTFWILLVNILVFNALNKSNFSVKHFLKPLAVILFPILISYFIYFTYWNNSGLLPQKVVIVQPNIDPYNEKFAYDFNTQFNKMLHLIKGKITNETNFLILPETFVTDDINEENLQNDLSLQLFKDSILSKFPQLNIVTGINSYMFYKEGEKPSATARLDGSSGMYYDYYNAAAIINANGIQVYHKSKLVPGVELMPFPALLKPLESLAINMGGTIGSLGTQKNRTVFKSNNNIGVAPVICYESVYSDYCTEYIRNGANFIFIVTNDGWWDNTPGHKQHLSYARLRAIENRRCIARSANTGISAIINEKGEILQPTNWWEPAVIEAEIKPNTKITFYAKFGDILSVTCVFVAILALLYYWYLRFFKR